MSEAVIEQPRTVTIGGHVLPIKDVFKALTDRDLHDEADRRGLVDEWGDFADPSYAPSFDIDAIPDWLLRQNIPRALQEIEKALSGHDSRFTGLADDVERHYARASCP